MSHLTSEQHAFIARLSAAASHLPRPTREEPRQTIDGLTFRIDGPWMDTEINAYYVEWELVGREGEGLGITFERSYL